MLGWWFQIDRAGFGLGQCPAGETSLASWESGTDGLRWIDELVEAGDAEHVGGDGYPFRYIVRADFVLPMLTNRQPPALRGAPAAVDGEGGLGVPKFHGERIAACSPAELLHVEVWDLS